MTLALVTGASGFVGSRLCHELKSHGYDIRILQRKSSDINSIKELKPEIVIGDLENSSNLDSAVEGVDVVFHIAALYREAKFADSVYWKVNYEGTQNLLNAAVKSKVKKFIYCSTIGVHSTIKNPPANENEPYAPTDVYQETKVAAEKFVLEQIHKGLIEGCVIRPAMIWGPRDKRFLKFFKGIYHRKLPIIGRGGNWCHWILVDDLVRAFRLAYESNNSNGQVYIIAGERPVSLKYTMSTIASIYNVKLLPFHIPVLPIQIAGSIVESICRPFGIEPPLHRRRADFFIKNRAFDCSKAKQDLGFNAAQPFEKEAEIIANWYLKQGWL
jgi:nucleoside-diphosphate-sugar epimerase